MHQIKSRAVAEERGHEGFLHFMLCHSKKCNRPGTSIKRLLKTARWKKRVRAEQVCDKSEGTESKGGERGGGKGREGMRERRGRGGGSGRGRVGA